MSAFSQVSSLALDLVSQITPLWVSAADTPRSYTVRRALAVFWLSSSTCVGDQRAIVAHELLDRLRNSESRVDCHGSTEPDSRGLKELGVASLGREALATRNAGQAYRAHNALHLFSRGESKARHFRQLIRLSILGEIG